MPPLNTYIFNKLYDEKVTITIKAYSLRSAWNQLVEIVKNPADFTNIN